MHWKYSVSVNCAWSNWSEFGLCSQTCGNGFQTRTRFINSTAQFGGKPCDGDFSSFKSCYIRSCFGKFLTKNKQNDRDTFLFISLDSLWQFKNVAYEREWESMLKL